MKISEVPTSKLLQSLLPNHKSDDKDQDLLGARQLGPLHISIQLVLKNPVSLGTPAKLHLQIKGGTKIIWNLVIMTSIPV